MTRGEARDAAIWQALRAARARPAADDPRTAIRSLADARDEFLERVRVAGVPCEVRHHAPVRHARHLAATWARPLGETLRATLFDADGDRILVVVPADRKVEAPRLRQALGAARLSVLRADRGVGALGWVNLPGDPGPLPGLPAPFGARLAVDLEVLALDEVVFAFSSVESARVSAGGYVAAAGGVAVDCVGRTRLLSMGGAISDPPRRD